MSLRGGESPLGAEPETSVQTLAPFPPRSPLSRPNAIGAMQDVAIHAVIVSGVQSPWDAISKAAGVRDVMLTGGLVALGKARAGEPVAGGRPPSFLRIVPDPKLLEGSIIPPVIPNAIDVRIVNYSVTAEMPAK